MAAARSADSTPSSPFTTAAADLIEASAPIRSRDSGSPDTWKFCTARWVCAPHSASAGTSTSPIESCSTRVFMSAPPSSRVRPDAQQRAGRLGEEVVALVVHHHERREIADLDLPPGFHPYIRGLSH